MILNTGSRTDIPAYYSEWFYNRIREGYVCTRNPYDLSQVLKYRLDPKVVDAICFCTKNPQPMLARLHELDSFRQVWFVTLTSYGKDIEPNVPDKRKVLQSIQDLSGRVGRERLGWRYDPVFITEKYSVEYHLRAFEKIASVLENRIAFCVISFLDLYEKTKRNFPAAREVTEKEQCLLTERFVTIASRYGIPIRTCCENPSLARFGVDVSGCMTKEVLEEATECRFSVPKAKKPPRSKCSCLLGADIGMYNTCPHGCLYCYANTDQRRVRENIRHHDPSSSFLIGNCREGDQVIEMDQKSWLMKQLSLF